MIFFAVFLLMLSGLFSFLMLVGFISATVKIARLKEGLEHDEAVQFGGKCIGLFIVSFSVFVAVLATL